MSRSIRSERASSPRRGTRPRSGARAHLKGRDDVRSGRRPLSTGLLKLRERVGCGHVSGLLVQDRMAPAGPDEVCFDSSPHHAGASANETTIAILAQPMSEGRRRPPITVNPAIAAIFWLPLARKPLTIKLGRLLIRTHICIALSGGKRLCMIRWVRPNKLPRISTSIEGRAPSLEMSGLKAGNEL
jgi:hypothetical protein